jgi:hypothetical protein
MDVPFGPWQPDLGETQSMVIADNVLPHVSGYGPRPSLYVPSAAQALPAAPAGVFSFVTDTGVWGAFLFTSPSMYQLQSDFTLSLISAGFACPVGFDWSAIHFGTKFLFTNTTNGLQSYDVEAGGAVSYIAGAGDPEYIFTCANFVVALNCIDNAGNRNNRLIKTSGFNDQTNWTLDGADYQALASGEKLVAGFDLKNNTGLILQTHALTLISFGNAPGGAQFTLAKVADGKGSVGARSCVSFDGRVFYLDTDDFYLYSGDNVLQADGTASHGLKAIGANAITRWFLGQVDQSLMYLVQGSADPLNKVVTWRYKRPIDSSTTVSQVAIGYEWNIGRWFTLTEATAYLARFSTVGVSYNAATGSYDSQTLQYDDRFWFGNAPLAGGLDANYKFGVFTGPSLEAHITTQLMNNPISGKILWGTQITDALAPSLELGVKDNFTDAVTWTAASLPGESGRTPLEGRGLNIQFRQTIPAGDMGATGTGWMYTVGIDHLASAPGGAK